MSAVYVVMLRGIVSGCFWIRQALAVVLSAAVVALGACGGSDNSSSGGSGSSAGGGSSVASSGSGSSGSGGVVGQVGGAMITRVEVNHWMSTLASQFYLNLSHGHVLPDGLVSDPPSYARCVSSLEATAAAAPEKIPGVTGVVLLRKCRQMHRALKEQAMARLVRAQWIIGVAGEEGVKVSDAEVLATYRRASREQYPNPPEARQHLASAHTSVADELLLAKEELLANKMLEKVHAGGAQAQARFNQTQKRWIAKTSCHPGYIVQYCSQFTTEPAPTAASPPATVLMEQVATLAAGHCINTAACSKQ